MFRVSVPSNKPCGEGVQESRFDRLRSRVDRWTVLPALDGVIMPTEAGRTAVRRLSVMVVAALGGLAIAAPAIALFANAIFSTGINVTAMAETGLLLAAASLIGLALTVRLRLADQAFVATATVWAGFATWIAGTSGWMGIAILTGLALATLSGRSKESASATEQVEMTVPEKGKTEPAIVGADASTTLPITATGTAMADWAHKDMLLKVGDALVDRVHLNDRITFLQALSDARACSNGTDNFTCRVRFNIGGAQSHPSFELRQISVSKCGDGSLIASIETLAEAVPPQTGPDEKTRKLLAMVSHELRTPLNAIIGFSDVLKSGLYGDLSDPRQCESVDLINSAGKDLLHLVNLLLDVSKLDAGAYEIHAEAFDLTRMANDSVRLLSGQVADKKLHLAVRLSPDIDEAIADCNAVRQVMLNLLSNAIKFTPEGGCVTVETAKLEPNSGFSITVSDTGIGMTPEQVATACEAFSRADNSFARSGQGTGLGLALTKGLVELHGGEVRITSDPSIGTAVTVTFPHGVAPTKLARLEPRQTSAKIGKEFKNDEKKGKAA